ncbi:ATP-dependent RNA helicase RhlE [Sinorhizobium sojae CCBAU 05684]|uniref:DEAD-box ATP-dependent RNA helicase RhpA n=1 Tax=Sinorhizobium sojae CCBAU 05684 TaxID=716928 RepID=A0A249PE28_9HYPH|nr:DEAD/DEAH box helicase [Sinorhizobium sojae]ASY63924.1 ATP-dependent RNA helicase RhlE [Sinorhizobium sojae CCBAU 05684]
MSNFKELGLSQEILATLAANGFEKPTPIQMQSIPLVLKGHDLIGLAQTGTGKTAAFGLPMIEKLLADGGRADPRNIRALVLAPTRELVNQIATNLKLFVRKTPLKIGVVVGGVSINRQTEQLARGVDILVATPGRLLDLVARKAVTLTQGRYLVLDEADQMLDLGFIHDLRKISKLVPKTRQTLLFSATMPKQIAELAHEYLTDPVKVEVTPPGKAADKIEQYVHFVPGKDLKTQILKQSLTANPDGLSLIFSRTKHGAEKLMKHLDHVGFKAASIHGNKSQSQRERALKAFRDGEIRVLVATDVAARGIDITGVTHVYNYDLPEVPDAYVHRIGRTARNGRDGIAIAFCAPDEIRLLRDIEKLTGIEIAVASGEAPADQARPSKGRGGRGNGQNRGNGGGPRQDKAPRQKRPAREAAVGFAGDELLLEDRPQKHARRDQRATGHGHHDGRAEGNRNHEAKKHHHGRPGPQDSRRGPSDGNRRQDVRRAGKGSRQA